MTERLRIRVSGCVQGVGFRPHVQRLAERLALTGFVRNDPGGVLIEVQGAAASRFAADLRAAPPALARVAVLDVTPLAARADETEFAVAASAAHGPASALLPPDTAVCDACLAEMFTPGARRWRYAFTTCTDCGPRYTITRRLPYDRPHTSMAGFPLCADCAREYHDPSDRRCHAQPLACPVCGPRLDAPVETVVADLLAGRIVALKGLGGFHLACDARNEAAVARLRAAKDRRGKPFAVMVASLASAESVARLTDAERAALAGRDRPVMLAEAVAGAVAPSVAPDFSTIGVMLPGAPLHYLLFHEAAGRPAGTGWLRAPVPLVLVMTSANPAGAPIIADGAEARSRLAGIADRILDHDRPIVARADDSVVRVIDGAPRLLRRARGHVPQPIPLPRAAPAILALGGAQKVAACLTRGREAFLGPHVGTPDNAATLAFLEETAVHLRRLLGVDPVAVAHDLHPDFQTTRLAQRLGLPAIAVQHHHAHAAAVLAEHGQTGPALAVVFDGYGYGADGGAWGGELLRLSGAHCRRIGHLAPLQLPGGDAAARAPWRMAAAALHALGRAHEIAARFGHTPQAEAVVRLLDAPATPTTTSCGRLFDAAAGLLGLAEVSGFEARPAMLLEQLADRPRVLAEGWRIAADGALDLRPLLAALGADARDGANLFHGTLAAAAVAWAARAAEASGVATVALAGGCFANRVLTEAITAGLRARGLLPLLPRLAPCNDGGLSLGQAWVAALTLEES